MWEELVVTRVDIVQMIFRGQPLDFHQATITAAVEYKL